MHRNLVVLLVTPLALGSCGPSEDQAAAPHLPFVEAYRGNPEKYTASGFSRHTYPVRDCGIEIALKPPFQVSEDGWGRADIRAPLALLNDPTTEAVAPEGVEAQNRISFAFPSKYRGVGMKEWFAQGARSGIFSEPMSLENAASTLGLAALLKGNGTGGHTRYSGTLNGRGMAIDCIAGRRNPTCSGEIEIGSNGHHYLAIFPPAAAPNLKRILEIGDDLFAAAAAACKPM